MYKYNEEALMPVVCMKINVENIIEEWVGVFERL